MTKEQEALRLTLDWLESGNFVYPTKIRTAIKEALAQPAQEPVAWAVYDKRGGSKSLHWPENHSPNGDATMFDAVPLVPQRPWVGRPEERNFCPRCGKRTADLTTIHTCTPPQEKSND